jgi:lipopolysaccharide export system ATP-binding protein
MKTTLEALQRLLATLKPHDAAAGLALIELVRRAGPTGVLDRGLWLSAVLASLDRRAPGLAASHGYHDPRGYIEEQVLPLLRGPILSRGQDDHSHLGDTLRVAPSLWAVVQHRRPAILGDLEIAVRNLLPSVQKPVAAPPSADVATAARPAPETVAAAEPPPATAAEPAAPVPAPAGPAAAESTPAPVVAAAKSRAEPIAAAAEPATARVAGTAPTEPAPIRVAAAAEPTEPRIAPTGNGTAHAAKNGTSTLAARDLVKVYHKRKVVNEVDISVSQGEIVGLLGPNGAGKTTTFYVIVGLISPDRGKVFLDREELTRVPMYRRARRGIGYLAQEPSIFRKLTVEQNIMAILETMPLSRAERKARLESLLDELSIKHLRRAKAYSLSGGERRRLEITRALVSSPKFMLLDEPFAGVDPIAVHDIQQIVAGLRHRGIGVIITDHNVEQTLDIVDRAYIMYEGRVRVSGTVAELVWNDEVAEIYLGPTLTARMRERYSRPEVA